MYTLAVQRDFVGQHFLIGGDWGAENQWHSHHYRLEFQLEGAQLDQHGYLVDIVHVEELLEGLVRRYRDKTLNDLPEFDGLNPSIEAFLPHRRQQLFRWAECGQYQRGQRPHLGKRDRLGLLSGRAVKGSF